MLFTGGSQGWPGRVNVVEYIYLGGKEVARCFERSVFGAPVCDVGRRAGQVRRVDLVTTKLAMPSVLGCVS